MTYRICSLGRPVHAFALLLAWLAIPPIGGGQNQTARTPLKEERFDRDPGWEGFNNRVQPTHTPTVVQDFGFRPVKAGGRNENAIGGRVTRSSRPAFYADRIGTKNLNDKLSASG